MGFVLAYRCGAAPDFHRVPYGLEDPRHQHDPQDMVVESAKSNNMLWSPRGDGQLVPKERGPLQARWVVVAGHDNARSKPGRRVVLTPSSVCRGRQGRA